MVQANSVEKGPLRLGQKVRAGWVGDLKESLSGVEILFVAKMDRVPTRDLNHLRDALKALQADFLVVKNSLCRLTFRELGWAPLEKKLEGTCGISPIRGELGAACKLLTTFSKDHEGFVLQGGVLKGQILESKDVVVLGKLPPREVLLSQLAGVIQSPLRSLAFLLQGPIRSLAVALGAVIQMKEKDRRPTNKEAESGDGRESVSAPITPKS
ncbi:MAG: 50S ribosomal protein L10 [Candidatus Omnitrophica bacterium]|nr:50S ribosomal protein L10 [Candidatus Omnitrophota bacterium]